MNKRLPSRTLAKCGLRLILALAVFLPQVSVPAQPTSQGATIAMKNFVIIFRQGPHPLTDTDKQRRAAETGVWARRQNDAGHKLDPHILAPESAHRGSEPSTVSGDAAWQITALLFLEAHDLNEAAEVAASHPALHNGANIEIRPWAAPVPIPPVVQTK